MRLARSDPVTVYDNYARGIPAWLEAARRERAPARSSGTTSACPLPDDMAGFDYVIHAAGIASPTYYRMHPIETMDANINGLRSLLD